MRASIAAAGIAVAVAATAHVAHAGRKVKAEFLCGTYVDQQIKDVLPNAKKPKLTDPVACALHLSAVGDATYQGNIHTVRYAVDASSGKRTKIPTSGKTASVFNTAGGGATDLEYIMLPLAAEDNGDVAFQPCEDFDVVASVFDDDGTYFTKTVHVAQACPKPKPMKADVRCVAAKGDDSFDVPDKQKRRLEVDQITCYLTSKDPRFDGNNVKAWGVTDYDAPNAGDGPTHHTSDPHTGAYQEGEDESAFSLEIPSDDVPVCLPTFAIKLYLDDNAGAHLFAKTLTVKQTCDD